MTREERMQETRKSLEVEADRLGVPWTYATTDAELHALVESRKHGGLTMAESAPDKAECHGLFWDYPRAKECKACAGHQSCFQTFVETTFPETVNQLPPDITLPDLAKALDVSEEAVLLAKNQQRQSQPPQSHQSQPPQLLQPPPVESAPEPEQAVPEPEQIEPDTEELDFSDADELEDELMAQPELETDAIHEAEPELEPEPEPPLENEPVAVKKKAPAKKKAAKKKATKAASAQTSKKKKKAAKAPPPEASEVQNPPPAESAKTAMGSASKKGRAKRAPRAKGQADQTKAGSTKAKAKTKAKTSQRHPEGRVADPWGPQTWPERYEKEKRNKWIAKLRPGMKLVKKYKKQEHEVKVLKRYYQYNGEKFPTLYMIVKEITGTKQAPRQVDKQGRRPAGTRDLCAWSAPRFFGLPALFTKP